MTFYQSRAISKAGLHVRRSAWSADKWLMIWRGTWFCFASGNPPHPVRATDYGVGDLLATDWTTMPAALAACPIDPAIGSTGGASAMPGTDGFPDDPTPPIRAVSGPDGPPVLPTPDPGTGITVTFDSILTSSGLSGIIAGVNLNRPVTMPADGSPATFLSGWYVSSPGAGTDNLQWQVSASRSGSLWHVELVSIDASPPSGGFKNTLGGEQPAGRAANNFYTTDSDAFYAGHATVGAR